MLTGLNPWSEQALLFNWNQLQEEWTGTKGEVFWFHLIKEHSDRSYCLAVTNYDLIIIYCFVDVAELEQEELDGWSDVAGLQGSLQPQRVHCQGNARIGQELQQGEFLSWEFYLMLLGDLILVTAARLLNGIHSAAVKNSGACIWPKI